MDTLLFKKQNSIGFITLNRPKVFNSFNKEMAFALQRQLDECAEDPEIRVIYFNGAGKAFCAGQDLQEINGEGSPELSDILEEHFNPIIERIRNMEKPIVGGVNGVAAGAGANLALACDITVAAESAAFIQAFSKIGLIPDSGGTFFLPRLIGRQRATALMMLGEKVTAKEAENMGMIYKCFKDKIFEAEALKIVNTLAQMPTKALGLTKRALNYSVDNDLTKQLAIENQLQTTASQTENFKEGVKAFIEKRKPVFKGE